MSAREQRLLVAGLLVFVLSFAHHTSGALLLPGLLVYLLWRRAAFVFRPRYLALFSLAGLLAVASYGYLYWRSVTRARSTWKPGSPICRPSSPR